MPELLISSSNLGINFSRSKQFHNEQPVAIVQIHSVEVG
jgi:hypothetical protein